MRKEKVRVFAFLMVLLMVITSLDIPASAAFTGNGVIAQEGIREIETTDSTEMEDAMEESIGGESIDEMPEMEPEREENSLPEKETANDTELQQEEAAKSVTDSEENIKDDENLLLASGDIAGGTVVTECADGTEGSITWSINAEGLLTIEGNGEPKEKESGYKWPWLAYADSVSSASVSLNNMASTSYMFDNLINMKTIDLTYCDTSQVTFMSCMFLGCRKLTDLDVSGFNTSKVSYMDNMFYGCNSLTDLDLSSFDTSQVRWMCGMFQACSGLTSLDLRNFDTGVVNKMGGMFLGCKNLTNLNVSNFKTTNVTDMNMMFQSCSNLSSLDVSGFDTSKVEDFGQMFAGCSKLTNLDVSGFNTSRVKKMDQMFIGCSGLTSLNVENFDTSHVTSMESMFNGCSGLNSLDVSEFDTSQVTDMSAMFANCDNLAALDLKNFNTSQVTDISGMFYNCGSLTTLDLNFLADTSQVTDMSTMFSDCSGLTSLDVSNLNTSQVTNMSAMFSGCSGLTSLDVSNFNTSQVTDMRNMFSGCSGLTSLDVSGFDTSQVTMMDSMFSGCSGLTSLDVSGFDTSQVTYMYSMFEDCTELTALDVSGFDTSQVTGMSRMFAHCSGLTNLDVSGFDTSQVTFIDQMFAECRGLTSLNLSSFDIKTDNIIQLLDYCYKLKRIETPKNVSCDVTLPITEDTVWTDSSGNEITLLPKELSVSTTIKRSDYNAEEDVKSYGISLYKRLLTIKEGETYTIKNHYTLPEGSSSIITWTSDNEKVATVDATGKVTAVASGNAVITASIADGSYTDTCKVTVERGESVAPSPSPSASASPTASPSNVPTASPSAAPSGTPTATPSVEPSASTSPEPSASPSVSASEVPSASPSVSASEVPSASPSTEPSEGPSTSPSSSPSAAPSVPGSKPQVDVTVSISRDDLETKNQTELNKSVAAAVSQTIDTAVSSGIDYNGSKQSVDLSLTIGEVQLAEGTDYSVKYTNAVNAGNAQMVIKFLGDYKNLGTVSKTFTINAVNIAGDEVAAANLYYEKGKTVKPVPVLYYNGKKLRAGKDFTYDTTKISADKTLTLKGMGNFSGSRDIKVVFIDKTTETRTSLVKAKVTINKKLVYTGTSVEPTGADFAVTIGSGKNKVELKQGVDYTVEFSNNDKPGTAAAVIRSIDGSKNCYGEKLVTFKLAGTKLSKAEVTLKVGSTVVGTKKGMEASYTGSAVIPNVTVKLTDTNGKKVELKEGTDYSVSYKKNRKKGTASIVITGIGAYTGSKTVKFKIIEK